MAITDVQSCSYSRYEIGTSLQLAADSKWITSLRSKRSRTKRTKFGPRVLVFRIRDARKMGREQKGGRKG